MSKKEAFMTLENVLHTLGAQYQPGSIGRDMVDDGLKALRALKAKQK